MDTRRIKNRIAILLCSVVIATLVYWIIPGRTDAFPNCDSGACFVVMSENLYVGADVVPVVRASLSGRRRAIIRQVTRVWKDVLATNFPERADVIARQIIHNRADFVALQEVALIRTGIPDAFRGNCSRAGHVELDFLQILLNKLAACGVPYSPVAVTAEADIELPGYVQRPGQRSGCVLRDIRFTDRLAILVRSELIGNSVQISNPQGCRFNARVVIPMGLTGRTLEIDRGWNAVDVEFGPSKFRLINMCLETNPFPLTQAKQAREILCGPACTSLPVVLAGDSNSDANHPCALAYRRFIRSGFEDAWTRTRGRDPGYTYGNDADLRNPIPLTHHPLSLRPNRFAQVLYRGPLQARHMKRVGIRAQDRTVTGMWPSDHAGVVATLFICGQ